MIYDEAVAPEADRRTIIAKKRYIDPIIIGKGRLSDNNEGIKRSIEEFLDRPLDRWVCGA